MKKIILLLLISVASYGQAVFDEGIQLSGNGPTTSTTKLMSQDANGFVNFLNALTLPVSTATQAAIDAATIPDATATIKGKLKLAGDLGGTADMPTVPGLLLKENLTNKAVDFSIVNNTLYPTVQATKAYADELLVGLWNDRGNYTIVGSAYPTTGGSGSGGAIIKGNAWQISGLGAGVQGTIGTKTVNDGDVVRALINSPGNTDANWAIAESNIGFTPANDANVLHKTLDESKSGRLSVSANSSSPTLSGASVTGVGVYGSSTSGTGVFANSASGIGLNVTNSAGNASDIAQFSTQGGSTAKIDYLANVTGKSFIKTGGTATQALLANGGILNNPISGTGTGLNSQVAFFTGSNSVSGNNGLRWDDTNKQLIINASSAGIKDVLSILNSNSQIGVMDGVRVYFRDFLLESLSTYGSTDGKLLIGTAASTFLTLLQNGNLGLGKTPTEVLDVAGRIKSDALAGTGIRMTLSQSDGTQIAGDVAPTSGTYTPTLTNVSNVTGLTVQKAYYTRIGNIVNVSVGFQFNITATSVNSRFTISLPVNRATNSAYNFGSGSVVTSNTPNELYPCILTSGSTSNITVYFVPAVTSTTYSGSVTFQYSVLD